MRKIFCITLAAIFMIATAPDVNFNGAISEITFQSVAQAKTSYIKYKTYTTKNGRRIGPTKTKRAKVTTTKVGNKTRYKIKF